MPRKLSGAFSVRNLMGRAFFAFQRYMKVPVEGLTHADIHRRRQTDTGTETETQRHRDTDRLRQTETDTERQKQIETETDREHCRVQRENGQNTY